MNHKYSCDGVGWISPRLSSIAFGSNESSPRTGLKGMVRSARGGSGQSSRKQTQQRLTPHGPSNSTPEIFITTRHSIKRGGNNSFDMLPACRRVRAANKSDSKGGSGRSGVGGKYSRREDGHVSRTNVRVGHGTASKRNGHRRSDRLARIYHNELSRC